MSGAVAVAVETQFVIATLERLRARGPRVQCLTNTVAQALMANCLLAFGAQVSMASHPDEVVDMCRGADAILINLGTLDAAREAAIPRVLAAENLCAKPIVLDPVFVQNSPLRMALAQKVIARGDVIVRGNPAEMAALRPRFDSRARTTLVATGAVDVIENSAQRLTVRFGHPLMARVTGMGCAAGAVIAAFAACETDPCSAAAAALTVFGIAGERAAERATGPGSFAVAFLDDLARIDGNIILQHMSRS